MSSAVNSFCKWLNNHKSSLNRYGKGQRGILGEHLYAHFFDVDHASLPDLSVNIIDKTDFNKPAKREAFWIYKLNTFFPKGLNQRNCI